jgi:hypothetical protein
LQQCEQFVASEDPDYEPAPIPDDFGLYSPDTAFLKYNFLYTYNILPQAGGLNDQHPHDIHDIRVLGTILRRMKWEKQQEEKEDDLIDQVMRDMNG